MDELEASINGARAYEALHVPSLFAQWAEPMLDSGAVTKGHAVLDVACGTGVVARQALRRVGSGGAVTGLDIDPGMLAVAEELEPSVTWLEGSADDLPFEDGSFDAVLCQFGLMFFPDRALAAAEMLRCARRGARVVVAVWEALERSDAYPIAVDLLARRAGPAAADALRAPFALGDADELNEIFRRAGASSVAIETRVGTARFPSIRSMFEADLRGWLPIMGVVLDETLIARLLEEAEVLLQDHLTDMGDMVFDAPAHIVTATA